MFLKNKNKKKQKKNNTQTKGCRFTQLQAIRSYVLRARGLDGPDTIRQTKNIGQVTNISPSSTRFDTEIAKISYVKGDKSEMANHIVTDIPRNIFV